ncbi:MAG: ABC transporter transmembrane domain-containing protein, partial [Thermomicrobiales bacterium]
MSVSAQTAHQPIEGSPRGGMSEFEAEQAHHYDRRSPVRWIVSHLLRYWPLVVLFLVTGLSATLLNGAIPGLTGRAIDDVLGGSDDPKAALLRISGILLAIVLLRALADVVARFTVEILAKRMERDTREELFTSLLGKSQTFHNRQRVGDLMARATNDVRQMGFMVSPGIDLIIDSMTALVVPFIFIAFINVQLLFVPILFLIGFAITLVR